jgi:hypothetical protein
MDTILNTPETYFDQRPSHNPRPAFVLAAEDAERDAWNARALAWDAYEQDPTDDNMEAYQEADAAWLLADNAKVRARAQALNLPYAMEAAELKRDYYRTYLNV